MTKFVQEEIKHLLSQRLGIRLVSPSDCAVIALAIRKKLKKNISETTIKRLFGFAAHQNQFSKFTINTLLEFIHDNESSNLAAAVASANDVAVNEDWDYLMNKGKIVSENTVHHIMASSTIPYACTVDRKFATHDFDYFYQSNYSFTVFVAQSGYGKSIMLSHLVQNQFLNANGKYSDDVVFFVTASRLFKLQQDDQQLTVDIQKMLGLAADQNLIEYFDEQYRQRGKKLVIFLDGFAEILQSHGDKPKIFDRLLQLFDDIQDNPAIKVVLTMRSYMWRRFFERIRHSHYLKTKWFSGSYFRFAEQANIPALTDYEVGIVLDRLNANADVKLNGDIKSLFRHPFYLAYYYMLQESYANTDYITHLISYEIVLRHMLSKIYQTKHAIEKVILCKKIIHHSNYGKNGDKISKKHLIADPDFHKNAYMELLLEGILAEEQRNENGFLVELVHFVQPHIFDYFLFKENLELHEMKISEKYFDFLFENYKTDRQQLFALLKWSTFQIVKHGEFDLIKYLLNLDLTSQEYNQLLLFLTKNIKHQIEIDPYSKILLSSSTIHQELLQKFIHLDFFDPCYQQSISILIEIATDHDTLATYRAILVLFSTLTFDVNQIVHTIGQLQQLQFDDDWEINPLQFAEFLLAKLTGKPTLHLPMSQKLRVDQDAFAMRPLAPGILGLKQAISSLYLVNLTWVFGTSVETINLITQIHQAYGMSWKRSLPLSRYLLYILALEVNKLGASKKATQLVRMLNHLQNCKLYTRKSQWSTDVYEIFLAYHYFNEKEHQLAIAQAGRCISKFKTHNFIALEMMCHQLLVKVYSAIGDIDKANEHRYMILNHLESNRLNMQLFDCPMPQLDKMI